MWTANNIEREINKQLYLFTLCFIGNQFQKKKNSCVFHFACTQYGGDMF